MRVAGGTVLCGRWDQVASTGLAREAVPLVGKAHALGHVALCSIPASVTSRLAVGTQPVAVVMVSWRGCSGKPLGRGGGRIERTLEAPEGNLSRRACGGIRGHRPSRLLLFQNLPRLGENLSVVQRTAQKGSKRFGRTGQAPLIPGLRDGTQEPRLPMATWRGWLSLLFCSRSTWWAEFPARVATLPDKSGQLSVEVAQSRAARSPSSEMERPCSGSATHQPCDVSKWRFLPEPQFPLQ